MHLVRSRGEERVVERGRVGRVTGAPEDAPVTAYTRNTAGVCAARGMARLFLCLHASLSPQLALFVCVVPFHSGAPTLWRRVLHLSCGFLPHFHLCFLFSSPLPHVAHPSIKPAAGSNSSS